IASAHRGTQPPRHFDQATVARVVSVQVVYLLEAVEVDEHARELEPAAPCALDGLLERRAEARAIGKAGERIAVGKRGDALARERAFSDVASYAAVAEERAIGRKTGLTAQGEVARGAIGHCARELEIAEGHVALQCCPVRGPTRFVGAHRGDLPGCAPGKHLA